MERKKEKSNNVAVFKTYLHIFLYYVGIRLVWKCNRLDRGFVLMALFPRILLNFKSYYVGLVNCTKAGKDSKENFLILSSAWCPPVELHKNYFFLITVFLYITGVVSLLVINCIVKWMFQSSKIQWWNTVVVKWWKIEKSNASFSSNFLVFPNI